MQDVSLECWAEMVAIPDENRKESKKRGCQDMINDVLYHEAVAKGQPFYVFTEMDAEQATRELLHRFCKVSDEKML
jgi:hypothetical protein